MRKTVILGGMIALLATLPVGCGRKATKARLSGGAEQTQAVASRGASGLPPMRWDHVDTSGNWTRKALKALDEHGRALPAMVPRDIGTYCPGYPSASRADRKAFWVGLLSALAKHESTWNPRAVGGGGQWFGLVQIAPATAKGYGCRARSGADLKKGGANLSCAIRIMAHTVPRDGVVSEGWRGVAADWGPFHQERKRTDIQAWTRAQPYCR